MTSVNANISIPAAEPVGTVTTIFIYIENEVTHLNQSTTKNVTVGPIRAGGGSHVNSNVPPGTKGQAFGIQYGISYAAAATGAARSASSGYQGHY